MKDRLMVFIDGSNSLRATGILLWEGQFRISAEPSGELERV